MSAKIGRTLIKTLKAPSAIGPYNQAVIKGNTMYISGQIGMNPRTMELVPGGVQVQARQVMENLGEILKAAGIDYSHLVKVTVLLKEIDDFIAFNSVYKEFFNQKEPARAAYQVKNLPKGSLVEVEAVAVLGVSDDDEPQRSRLTSSRKIVATTKAPSAIGPYSQAVIVNDLIYISGQIAMDPKTKNLVSNDIYGQMKQTMENMKQILKSAGITFDNVLKTTILLKDIRYFDKVNEIYKEYFTPNNEPARAAYEVVGLPKGALVEMEAVAFIGNLKENRKIINTSQAPSAIGPYNQAIKLSDKIIFISGQIPIDPRTKELIITDIKTQTKQVLENMGEILKASQSGFENVLKTTVLLQDINDFTAVNEVYKNFFKSPNEPARAAFQVSALPKGAGIEIEAIASCY